MLLCLSHILQVQGVRSRTDLTDAIIAKYVASEELKCHDIHPSSIDKKFEALVNGYCTWHFIAGVIVFCCSV